MTEKSPRKQRRLLQADLNFIAEHTLESIRVRLENPTQKRISGLVTPVDADTAHFMLRYQRNGRDTAVVQGVLQRWAGDMTHIYCEGRAFQRQQYGRIFLRLLYRSLLILPVILVGQFLMFIFFGFLLPAAWVGIMFWTFAVIIFAGMIIGVRELMRFLISAPDDDPLLDFKPQPEAKDRERLLDYLAEVIRDGAVHPVDHLAAQNQASPAMRDNYEAGIISHSLVAHSKTAKHLEARNVK